MKMKSLQRTMLSVVLVGGAAATTVAQIPLPPLPPGLNVRITTGRPPAPRREVRPARPGADYVWIAGFYNNDGGRYGWIPGRWERRAAPDAYWIPARYNRTTRGTIYEPGHWSNQQLVVEDSIRQNREWRRHERNHEREMQQERDRNRWDRDRQ
ncbi:MAG: YXWGXW repeat-containing protein [Acidobacteriota bacterium]|nr:YXWGXW repeat-containing protein [Acidobacteriota bacterium]